ncbi:MAG: hypothetical protein ABIJ92_04225 [Candidatus Aenigmatarchaeota archaeon]
MTDNIDFSEFQKVNIRIGTIEAAEPVENTEKLLRLQISLGEEKRQIVSSIAKDFTPDQLIGKQIPILTNLEPKSFRGIESQGMILLVVEEQDGSEKLTLITPENKVPTGSTVR